MSYYEEGLGQILPGASTFITGVTVNRTGTTSQPLINVGVPPDLVKLYGTYLWNTGMSMGMSDTNRPVIILVGGAMKAPRLNTFGLVDPAWVTKVLTQIPDGVRAWLEHPGAPSIKLILADIAAGKYAGKPAPLQISPLSRTNLLSTTTAATSALRAQVASTAVMNAQTKQAVADQATERAAQTQTPSDIASAQQAQAAADQAAATAQATANDAANAAIQVAAPGDGTTVGPSDLVATPDTTVAPMQPDGTAAPAGGAGGIPWLYIGVGAAGLAVVGWLVMSRGSSTPNRRRAKKNRRHSKRTRRARKA